MSVFDKSICSNASCVHIASIQSVVNTSKEAVLILDSCMDIKIANKTFCKIFGIGIDSSVVGRKLEEVFVGKDAMHLVRSIYNRDLRETEVFEVGPISSCSQSSMVTAELQSILLGSQEVFICRLFEKTEFLKLEEEKKRAVEIFQQTERVGSIGGWDYDLNTGKMFWSDQVYRIHELPMGEIVPIDEAINFYEGESREIIRKAVSDATTLGVAYDLELTFVTAKGRRLVVRACGEPIYEDGKIVRLAGSFQDITQQKEREREQLEEQNKRIREVEYARELIHNQARALEKEKNKAEEASKVKGQFLANISHEIRTPLNGVLGMTELLLDTNLNDDQIDLARNIQSSATNLLETMEDVLQFSRLEANKSGLNTTSGMLSEFLEELPLLFSKDIQEKDIIFVESFDPLLSLIEFDHSKLRQVLINVLGNAFKFTQPGGAIVHQARIEFEDEDEVRIKFAVTDTGPGIPPDDIEKVFEPFYQVDSSSTREYGGTGLGLAISKEIVSLMGGDLRVKSRLDCGACFFFSLTLRKGEKSLMEMLEGDEKEEFGGGDKQLHPLRILIAEDIRVNQKIMEKQLKKDGHILTFANDGIEALGLYKSSSFDLILMDIQMPKMSGDQVTAEIRALELGTDRHVPIVACTAHALPGDSELFIKMGADYYLSKPVKGEELRKVVAYLGDKSRQKE